MSSPRIVSTTALAKRNNIEASKLFSELQVAGLLQKKDGAWLLTEVGEAQGGTYIESKKYGRYVGWPDDFNIKLNAPDPPDNAGENGHDKKNLLTATPIGQHFNLSANKCNYIFSELGWLRKGLKGWLLTDPGKRLGGVQSEDHRSGIPYARWPKTILENRSLIDTVAEVKGTQKASPPAKNTESTSPKEVGFREKFAATHRAADGHFVRSRAEMLIDNWLYMAEIVHAYERKLPIEEDVYCDFYIPTGKVYIEFWGLENDPKYRARKDKKKSIYEKYGFNLIELTDADVLNLDDILPRHLLKYGVQAY